MSQRCMIRRLKGTTIFPAYDKREFMVVSLLCSVESFSYVANGFKKTSHRELKMYDVRVWNTKRFQNGNGSAKSLVQGVTADQASRVCCQVKCVSIIVLVNARW